MDTTPQATPPPPLEDGRRGRGGRDDRRDGRGKEQRSRRGGQQTIINF